MLSMHSYVICLDGANVLIDACNGNCKQRSLPFINMLDTPLANLRPPRVARRDRSGFVHPSAFRSRGLEYAVEIALAHLSQCTVYLRPRDYEHWARHEDAPAKHLWIPFCRW
jgi:hypothetical protein